MKTYVGKGWNYTFSDSGNTVVDCSVKLEELKKLPVNEYGEVRFTVSEMKQKDVKSGATHTIYALVKE